MRFPFRRKPKLDLSTAIASMTAGAKDVAKSLAALAPADGVSHEQIAQVEDFFCKQLRDDVAARGSISQTDLIIVWPMVEAQFKRALHESLYAAVPIATMEVVGTA